MDKIQSFSLSWSSQKHQNLCPKSFENSKKSQDFKNMKQERKLSRTVKNKSERVFKS